MILILQLVTSGVLVLAVVIVAGLGYTTYRKYSKSKTSSTIDSGPIRRLADKNRRNQALSELGAREAVIQEYTELKNIISNGHPDEETLTEREVIDRLTSNSRLLSARSMLENVYAIYERAKFGTREIGKEDFETFSENLDGVIKTLETK